MKKDLANSRLLYLASIVVLMTTFLSGSTYGQVANNSSLESEYLRQSNELAQQNMIVNAVAVVISAFAGGYIGAHFTAKFAEKKEYAKFQAEARNVQLLIKSELEMYLSFFVLVKSKSTPAPGKDGVLYFNDAEVSSQTRLILPLKPQYYNAMKIETKANCFTTDILKDLEFVYRQIEKFGEYPYVSQFSGGTSSIEKSELDRVISNLENVTKKL